MTEEYSENGIIQKIGFWLQKAGSFYLNVPFNRFLLYSISYVAFVCIVISLCVQTITQHDINYTLKHHHRIQWTTSHTLLSTFIFSMLLIDILSSIVVKKKPFSGSCFKCNRTGHRKSECTHTTKSDGTPIQSRTSPTHALDSVPDREWTD